MKQYTGRRAVRLGAIQVEVARRQAVVKAIWDRDEFKCKHCQRKVNPPAMHTPSPGYVQWRDPRVITVDGGFVVCRQHWVPQMVTL